MIRISSWLNISDEAHPVIRVRPLTELKSRGGLPPYHCLKATQIRTP